MGVRLPLNRRLIRIEVMSAKIYYLRPFQREPLGRPPAEPQAEEEPPEGSPMGKTAKRPARNALPGGRNSKWKRKLGGGAVRRYAGTGDKDSGSEDEGDGL